MSRILFTGGVPGPRGCLLWGVPGPGGCMLWGVPAPGGAWSGGCLVRGMPALEGACSRDAWWRPPDGYCCRQYASYWNAFLLHVSVILFTGGSAPLHAGIHHPTPPRPEAGTSPSDRGRHTPSGAVHAGRYGQQVGSMHPTGMQSC